MQGNKLVLIGLTVSMLTACGGGSDDNATTPIVNNIKGRVIHETACGNQAYPSVEVLVHDSAGKIVKRARNTDDGEFSLPWTAGDTHISFINNGVKLHAKTLLNVSAGDLGLIPLDSDYSGNCNCTYVDFNTAEIMPLYPNTQLMPSRTNVKTCTVEGQYQGINLALVSNQDSVLPIATVVDITNTDINNAALGKAIVLSAEQFSGVHRQGKLLSLNGVEPGDNLSTGSFSSRQSGFIQEYSWEGKAYAFPQLFKDEYVSVSHSKLLNLPNTGTLFFFSAHSQKITATSENYDVDVSRDFQPLLQTLQPLLQGIAANQVTDYDFSQYDSNISAVNIVLRANNWDWSIEGAQSGTFPLLSLPDDAITKINLSSRINTSVGVILISSKNSATYTEFRQEWAKVSRDNYFLPNAKISMLNISGRP